jgi:flagellar basal-body rod protein FlgC
MISSLNTSLSGLNAFQQQLSVAANNLANVNTDGFKQSQIVLSSVEPQGVVAASKKLELPGPLALEQSADGVSVVEKSHVDVSQEMTSLTTAKRAYQANLKALKAADETVGSLLDVVGR